MAEISDYPWNPDIAIRRMLTLKDVPGAFLSPRTEPDSLNSFATVKPVYIDAVNPEGRRKEKNEAQP